MLKKIIIRSTIILFVVTNFSFAQNFNWITPNKTYLKLYVTKDGMVRLNRSDFSNAGINTSGVDPRTVKIIYKGVQVPAYFFGEQDGVFNDGDYCDFYGSRNTGGLTNSYDAQNTVAYTTNEYFNQYSDTNTYWVDWGGAQGLRYSGSGYSTSNIFPSSFNLQTIHFEKDKVYAQGQNYSSSDYGFLNTEKYIGEGWYWSLISTQMTVSDTFSLPVLYDIPQICSLKVSAFPFNIDTSIPNEHKLEVRVNNNLVSTILSDDFKRIDTTVNFSSSLLTSSSVNRIEIKYIAASGFAGVMYIDYFELKYPGSFKLSSNKFSTDINSTDTTSKLFSISGYNNLNSINIYDVKNNFRISNFTNNGDTLKFTSKGNAKIEIVNDSIRNKPGRIQQRQVPNLASSTNGVDYLLIYHSLFAAQAEQLRAYRQTHDNFRAVKVEIEDIYDIYNYGQEDPVAVRNFVNYVNNNWQLPKVKFVCLFGRGSLDPKKNSSNSIYEKNYIPVYGYPASDGYFANFNFGSFCYYDQLSIGRIPAYYTSEAQTMVDKIISYESETSARWWKTFTFITGGSTQPEQQSYQQRSNFEANLYVTSPPISGEVVKIYRSDASGSNTFNYADSIKNTINRGTVFVNFRGHAGSHDWEVGMTDPNILSNGNKLPIILSLTCFTGENAKPEFRGFGEKFMYLGGKGAIGFVSTTGWSFAASGNDFGTYVIQSLKIDTNRRMGDLTKSASKSMSRDSLSFSVRNTINSYNLLGDPAVTLELPKAPEFAISNNDYKMLTPSIVLNQPTTLMIAPKNYGLYADSCRIRFQLIKNNLNHTYKDTVYKAFRFLDTILYTFKIDTSGVYKMKVSLDVDNRYTSEDESNNSITFNIPFNENSYLPLKPVENSLVFQDSVEFSGLNPLINLTQNNVKAILQLDTNSSFNSPVLQTFLKGNLSGSDTKFKAHLPVLNNNTLYYWRTNSIVNNDTTGWTKTKVFIYNTGYTPTSEKDRPTTANDIVNLKKYDSEQFSESDYSNTSYNANGIKLNEYPVTLFARSLGSNAEEASYFSVGNSNIYIDAGLNTGLNLIKVKKLNGTILEFKNLKMTSTLASDSLVTFLNTFDTTYYMMLVNAAYVAGGTYLTSAAKNKLRQFGSIYCDSIGLISYFHTWSFIGYLGANHSQVSEMYDPCCRPAPLCTSCDHWTASISTMNVTFKKTSGTLTNLIGPAKEWTEFFWDGFVPQNSSLVFDIIGIDYSGNQTLIRSNVQTNKFVELSTIDAKQYPMLNLLAKFNIDTVSGNASPVFDYMNVNYSPAAELVLDRNSLQVNSVPKDNSIVNFSFDYHNSGFGFIYGTIINIYEGAILDSNILITDTVSAILKTDSTLSYSNSFTPLKFRDSTRIFITIRPRDFSNEFYTYNNTADFKIDAPGIVNNSKIEVLSDGKVLSNGDYVSKNPEIKIRFNGMSKGTSDTTQVSIMLNEKPVPYFTEGKSNQKLKPLKTDEQLSQNDVSLMFYPEMGNGKNLLSVIYNNGSDRMDTLNYDVYVSNEFLVSDLYNFPNPMKNETDFIFNLEGAESQNLFKLKIYTVSGRLIKQIEYSASIGNNKIPWDGKDNDGDIVANGVYLYKLIYEGDSQTEFKTQKLVVLK